jgi:hypothetical protein
VINIAFKKIIFNGEITMMRLIKNLLLSVSVIGVSAIATSSAFAAAITGAKMGGSAINDYYVYDANSTSTFLVVNPTSSDVQRVLGGNASSPTGNIELRASSEKTGFDFTKNTSVNGVLNGENISISSLTSDDWFGAGNSTTIYGANNLANTWFNAAFNNYGISNTLLSSVGTSRGQLFNAFLLGKGFQRFSDPNISYINQNDVTGEISIGLAGHYDATNLLLPMLTSSQQNALKAALGTTKLQASELVKVLYNGQSQYLYNFSATSSGLVNNVGTGADGISHSGNYELKMAGVLPPLAKVPESSPIIGLIVVGGLLVVKRQVKKA